MLLQLHNKKHALPDRTEAVSYSGTATVAAKTQIVYPGVRLVASLNPLESVGSRDNALALATAVLSTSRAPNLQSGSSPVQTLLRPDDPTRRLFFSLSAALIYIIDCAAPVEGALHPLPLHLPHTFPDTSTSFGMRSIPQMPSATSLEEVIVLSTSKGRRLRLIVNGERSIRVQIKHGHHGIWYHELFYIAKICDDMSILPDDFGAPVVTLTGELHSFVAALDVEEARDTPCSVLLSPAHVFLGQIRRLLGREDTTFVFPTLVGAVDAVERLQRIVQPLWSLVSQPLVSLVSMIPNMRPVVSATRKCEVRKDYSQFTL